MNSRMRKLAAIMFTDIVGFSRIMTADERKAFRLLEKHRAVLQPLVQKYQGQWLKDTGDGALTSFNSAVQAVNCALETQHNLRQESDLKIRIGIHVGDVLFANGDVLGDGVNIAKRIEGQAEAGGICVSEKVYDDIRNQPYIEAEFVDDLAFNVGRPIKLYALYPKGSDQGLERRTQWSASKRRADQQVPLHILIADDVQETRRNTRLMLSLIPEVEVVAMARNGREAIILANRHNPDVAIMDVNMPEVDGLSAIHTMLKEHPDLVCIVISAEKDNQTLQQAMAAGAREYLIKPFTSEELLEAIQRAGHLIRDQQRRRADTDRLRIQRDKYLVQLARQYERARRTDDDALQVFEELAANPKCEIHWLRTLAMVYVVRNEWHKLRGLAARLEQQEGQQRAVAANPPQLPS